MDKAQMIKELEELSGVNPGLEMALSPLLTSLRGGTPTHYRTAGVMLTQLADGFEKTGIADSSTIDKLRQIAKGLENL